MLAFLAASLPVLIPPTKSDEDSPEVSRRQRPVYKGNETLLGVVPNRSTSTSAGPNSDA